MKMPPNAPPTNDALGSIADILGLDRQSPEQAYHDAITALFKAQTELTARTVTTGAGARVAISFRELALCAEYGAKPEEFAELKARFGRGTAPARSVVATTGQLPRTNRVFR